MKRSLPRTPAQWLKEIKLAVADAADAEPFGRAIAHVPVAGSGFRGVTLAHNVRSREKVSEVLALAAAVGATITKPAQDTFWGGHGGYFSDPDGHLWEIVWNPFFPFAEDGRVVVP